MAGDRCERSNVFNDVTFAANCFHPTYRGKKLHSKQHAQINDFIIGELTAEGLESCRMFAGGEEIFGLCAQKNIVIPKTYWYYAKKHKHIELSELASKLLKIPASTTQLERLLSDWKFIHSDVRNRLGEATPKKLLNIYFSLRSNDSFPDDTEFPEIRDD